MIGNLFGCRTSDVCDDDPCLGAGIDIYGIVAVAVANDEFAVFELVDHRSVDRRVIVEDHRCIFYGLNDFAFRCDGNRNDLAVDSGKGISFEFQWRLFRIDMDYERNCS